ncbi:hypothetical protein [Herbaspirillum robiniae]|uniref:Uncharacterized protein n=1 Tax=Herbaspirillum robiniae TaxID=2014887 RepID=A0A246WN29_9BURK|nr:hypothetical protein [Herbaspirillum robiniae]OWY27774.1 hypothetical protein CEJ42_16940 [Herbaspirillum robiniae]
MRTLKTSQRGRDPKIADAILTTVADMLTQPEQEAQARISAAPVREIDALHKAFSSDVQMNGVHARKWRAHTLSRLPLSQWKEEDGFFSVLPFGETSLKYLNAVDLDENDGRALNQLENREVLCDALKNVLPAQVLEQYLPMLEWIKVDTYDNAHPLLTDLTLSLATNSIEYLFYKEYRKVEAEWRSRKSIPETMATPFDWMSWLGEQALRYSKAQLVIWDVLPSPFLSSNSAPTNQEEAFQGGGNEEIQHRGTDGQLTLELLCNIVANRALLESAKIAELASRAAAGAVKLLSVLNGQGIVAAPQVENDDDIREILSMWFGLGGLMSAESGFGTPLQGTAMEVVIHQAGQVQLHYLHTRAGGITRVHASTQHKFIFALALVACMYGGEDVIVDKEFMADTNPTYAPFPSQSKGLQKRLAPLGAHAREMIKSLYGQIYFANEGWEIRADKLQSYMTNMALKRSCAQELVFDVFKRLPPLRLLTLWQKLNDMADQQQAKFDRYPPGMPRPATRLEYMFAGIDDLIR